MRSSAANLPKVEYDTILLKGGMDQITPTLMLQMGAVRDALNYECAPTGGYTRVAGYERYDGHFSPSAASFAILNVTGSNPPGATYATVTGQTSGATGIIVASTSTYYVVTALTGAFNNGEVLKNGATTIGTLVSTGASLTAFINATYQLAASNYYRSLISAVPGSGAVLGGFEYKDTIYAFRNNAGGTASLLYQATSSGWVNVPLFQQVYFTVGSVAPIEGSTITKGAVTATVKRVVLQSGAWAGGTAAGKLIITNITGGSFTAGALTSGGTLTLSGASTQISLLPSGKYECIEANFTGSSSTIRIYGCDGVNKAFEFDGTTYVPIDTGTTPDTPSHIAAHKEALFLAIGSNAIPSSPGLPYDYTAINGSVDIAVGGDITGFEVQPGAQTTGTLAIFTLTDTNMLYGTGSANWNLVAFNTGTGAIPYTSQNMAETYVMDTRGVIGLQATLSYGNFEQETLTAQILPFIQARVTKVNGSCLCRQKNQYRLFFNDGYGLSITVVNGNSLGCMPFYHPITNGMNNVWESTLSTGAELILGFGSDGYVYQLETGTSFDGQPINSYLLFPYNPTKSPRVIKRYRKAALNISGSTYTQLTFSYNLGYGKSEYAAPSAVNYVSGFLPGEWDNGNWDSSNWDGQTSQPIEAEMVGSAENVQIFINSSTNLSSSFTLESMIVHYSLRRGLR